MTAAGAPSRGRDAGLEFVGRVVAGQCHELTNVLNVLSELCGLQDDLLPRARQGVPAALARLEELVGRARAQLERGAEIIRHVHRFAHSVTAAGVAFDARDVVERAVFLGARDARLLQAALEVRVPDEAVTLESDPFRLQRAIQEGVALLLTGAAGRRVTVTLTATPEGARVGIESADPVAWDHAVDVRLAAIATVLQAMDGELQEMPRHAAFDRLALLVPRRAAPRGEVIDAS